MIPFLGGVRIIESVHMVEQIGEDWSGVRSPARAKRRLARGFPQRIKPIMAPKKVAYAMDGGRTMVMHPAMARELREQTRVSELVLPRRFL